MNTRERQELTISAQKKKWKGLFYTVGMWASTILAVASFLWALQPESSWSIYWPSLNFLALYPLLLLARRRLNRPYEHPMAKWERRGIRIENVREVIISGSGFLLLLIAVCMFFDRATFWVYVSVASGLVCLMIATWVVCNRLHKWVWSHLYAYREQLERNPAETHVERPR